MNSWVQCELNQNYTGSAAAAHTVKQCNALSKQMKLPKRGVAPAKSVSPTRSAFRTQAVFVCVCLHIFAYIRVLESLWGECKQKGRPWKPISEFTYQAVANLLCPDHPVAAPRSCQNPIGLADTAHPLVFTHTIKHILADLHPPIYLPLSPASEAKWSHDVSNLVGIRVTVCPAMT